MQIFKTSIGRPVATVHLGRPLVEGIVFPKNHRHSCLWMMRIRRGDVRHVSEIFFRGVESELGGRFNMLNDNTECILCLYSAAFPVGLQHVLPKTHMWRRNLRNDGIGNIACDGQD